jgi:SAM-dependent methyltransferase
VSKAVTITINNCWEDYFRNPHEGLGTTYERFILHDYFNWLKARYKVQTILEAPSFGMTGVSGINSLWWASRGAKVTVVDQSCLRLEAIQKVWSGAGLTADFVFQSPESGLLPFADGSIDVAWNFAALWHVKDGETYLAELARVAKKALFLCVPNQQNICWVLRPHDSAEYELKNISAEWIISRLAPSGWRMVKTGFFDVPPWPDIAMKKENMLKMIGLGRLAKSMESGDAAGLCILDYFSGRAPAMEKDILKYGFLEHSPNWLKKRWAHHRFLLFEKSS